MKDLYDKQEEARINKAIEEMKAEIKAEKALLKAQESGMAISM